MQLRRCLLNELELGPMDLVWKGAVGDEKMRIELGTGKAVQWLGSVLGDVRTGWTVLEYRRPLVMTDLTGTDPNHAGDSAGGL